METGQISLECKSCISLQAVETASPPKTEWIFFSSPSGVALYAQQYSLMANVKLAALGKGTAAAIEEHLLRSPEFTSFASQPKEAMAEFTSLLKPNETVLGPRTEQSLKRLAGHLPESVLIDWPFYCTVLSPPEEATSASYLIFTSPSNADSYFGNYSLNHRQTCVSIGRSTASKLRSLGIQKILESKTPTEESLWEVISRHKKVT